jgi:hypothetical protein
MWTYQHSSVELSDATAERLAIGYSGSPAGENDPNKQDVSCVGPIPRRTYTISQPFSSSEHVALGDAPGARRRERDVWSKRIPSARRFDRSPGCASEGCIIMPRPVREKVWDSGDHRLSVVE